MHSAQLACLAIVLLLPAASDLSTSPAVAVVVAHLLLCYVQLPLPAHPACCYLRLADPCCSALQLPLLRNCLCSYRCCCLQVAADSAAAVVGCCWCSRYTLAAAAVDDDAGRCVLVCCCCLLLRLRAPGASGPCWLLVEWVFTSTIQHACGEAQWAERKRTAAHS